MLGWASLCNNPLPYLWLFPLAGSLDRESLNQRAWTSLSFFEHFAKLLPWGLLSFGSTWWKMSLIAEDRQGQAREKEHSKHSSRKRHSRVTEAAALVICCPDMKALLVALPFLESHFWILPYKANSALDRLAFFSVPWAHQAHFHHRAFAFAMFLCWECFRSELSRLVPSYSSQFKYQMLREIISHDLLYKEVKQQLFSATLVKLILFIALNISAHSQCSTVICRWLNEVIH